MAKRKLHPTSIKAHVYLGTDGTCQFFIPFPGSSVSVWALSLPVKQGQLSDRTRTTPVNDFPLRA